MLIKNDAITHLGIRRLIMGDEDDDVGHFTSRQARDTGQPALPLGDTMREQYGDDSSAEHIACHDCGMCIDCGDCQKYGCGRNEWRRNKK